MRAAAVLVAAALLAASPPAIRAEEPGGGKPAPPEPSTETMRGLRVELLVPREKPERGYSLLLYFHGRTATGKEGVTKLAPLAGRGFVIAAPWSKTGDWTGPEFEASGGIARDLIDRHQVAREHRHLAAHWSGSDAIPALGFEEDLGFRTCTWINSGWGGGTVPKWAKEELNGLFLWGAREGPSRTDNYRKSASMLAEKVRVCVARGEEPEPGLGRGRREDPPLPEALLPFWAHFLESMEGRFEPGADRSFEWMDDLEEARAAMAERKTGGFAFVFAAKPEAAEWGRTEALQNRVFFDRAVRHFADQLVPVKIERSKAADLLAAAKVEETPAVIVFKRGGKEVLKAVSGDISPKALVPPLRAVAPDQELPK